MTEWQFQDIVMSHIDTGSCYKSLVKDILEDVKRITQADIDRSLIQLLIKERIDYRDDGMFHWGSKWKEHGDDENAKW